MVNIELFKPDWKFHSFPLSVYRRTVDGIGDGVQCALCMKKTAFVWMSILFFFFWARTIATHIWMCRVAYLLPFVGRNECRKSRKSRREMRWTRVNVMANGHGMWFSSVANRWDTKNGTYPKWYSISWETVFLFVFASFTKFFCWPIGRTIVRFLKQCVPRGSLILCSFFIFCCLSYAFCKYTDTACIETDEHHDDEE